MNKPKWGSSFYEGAAEAARREADEAAKFDFRGRAEQLAMAARDIAALESINAELAEALRETHDALERLDAIYASEHDPDPVLGTVLRPAWLADALRHARTLLTSTAPDGGERVTITIDADAAPAAPVHPLCCTVLRVYRPPTQKEDKE